MFTVGMRLAPRKQETVNQCIESFRAAGFQKETIHIFAEPGKYKIKDKNIVMHMNEERLWDFANYNNALQSLVKMWDRYIILLEDDFIFEPNLKKELVNIINKRESFWYVSLYTDRVSWFYCNKMWWNDVRVWWGITWALFMYDKYVVEEMLKHPYYLWHLHSYKKNNATDCAIAELMTKMNLTCRYPNPSLAAHIGTTSTLWHDKDNARVSVNGFFKKECVERIVVGIASIPQRENLLEITIKSLIDQVDEINVWLNWYDHIPEFCIHPKIRPYLLDNSLWDAAKYLNLHESYWYYLTCDDDLWYPPDYAKIMMYCIDNLWKDSSIVSVHWHNITKKSLPIDIVNHVQHYYYFARNEHLVESNILWTWVAAFHTDALILSCSDFKIPNRADEQMAIFAKKQWVKKYVIPHDRNWVINSDKKEETPSLRKNSPRDKRIKWYADNGFNI